jgi:hypothetical protein
MIKKLNYISLLILVFCLISKNIEAKQNFNFVIVPIEVSLFPNPASSVLNINVSNIQSSNVEVTIFSYLGNIVYSETIDIAEGNIQKSINILNFRQGIYILQIKSDDYISTLQFKKL